MVLISKHCTINGNMTAIILTYNRPNMVEYYRRGRHSSNYGQKFRNKIGTYFESFFERHKDLFVKR